ncbi:hypothetical protein [Nocardioides sp. SYSU D00038]|nr:hypothetical protein [Nocardioides sp. SYSU D00038]
MSDHALAAVLLTVAAVAVLALCLVGTLAAAGVRLPAGPRPSTARDGVPS